MRAQRATGVGRARTLKVIAMLISATTSEAEKVAQWMSSHSSEVGSGTGGARGRSQEEFWL